MTATVGLSIAFLSGLAWAALDVARKSLTAQYHPMVIAAGMSAGSATMFALTALIDDPHIDLAAYIAPGLLSTTLAIVTQVLILESVRRSALSRTIPMLSFTPVATSLFGVVVLGEQPARAAWIGIFLVFGGALVLGLSPTGDEAAPRTNRLRFDTGALLMLMAALSISAAGPMDKLAVEASTTLVHGLVQSSGAALVLLAFLAVRGDLGRLSSAFHSRPAMTIAALLAFVAIGLQFLAYRGALVGEVETIKRVVGLASSLVAGVVIFDERLTLAKTLAAAALATGVSLILLSAVS